jgi:16S rRNA (adenine1518-N6/adenine1519-N6)-dimethyltransferase
VPHTKQKLEELLEGAGISPRHQWGQNFLIDLNLMRLLVEAAGLSGNETVLEVGCGTGSLTELLAKGGGKVVAVEIDRGLAEIAKGQLGAYKNVTLICRDILAKKSVIEPEVMEQVLQAQAEQEGDFLLIANLPYQVATPLMINLILGDTVPAGMFVTVQAEVAQRMAATAGTKEYGVMSILLQVTGEVKIMRTIKPQAFWPMPNVYSAMVSWRRSEEKMKKIKDIQQLKEVIDLLLGHRRKQIRSCLAKGSLKKDFVPILAELDIDGEARGETVAPEKFVELANRLADSYRL